MIDAGANNMNPVRRWFDWLFSGERRGDSRQAVHGLTAHYWDGAAPMPHFVRDINRNGLYLLTDQRWFPGTLVRMSLQRDNAPPTDPHRSVMVTVRVIRCEHDGVALAFLQPPDHLEDSQGYDAIGPDRKTLHNFLRRVDRTSGQALIEYILMLPLLFLLTVNIINFAGFFFAWITVANAARAGADYAILGGASAGTLSAPSATQIRNVIAQEVSSLPNGASITINICTNNNGTVTTVSGTCTSIPSDAEPANFVLRSVDVTYTYVPFIPAGFQFPNLHVYATLPPTSIHRRAVMRSIQ